MFTLYTANNLANICCLSTPTTAEVSHTPPLPSLDLTRSLLPDM